jgi:antitoxin (DNA-binding transcriptional repressor) of toxin-antitoxin stability system
MFTTIDVRELPARLSEALAIVSSGREVLLTDCVTPRATGAVRWARPTPTGFASQRDPARPDLDAPRPDGFCAFFSPDSW